jgi:CRP-like cAMP-binding protein
MHEALRLFAVLQATTIDWILSTGAERDVARDEVVAVEGRELGLLLFVLNGLFEVRLGGHKDSAVALLGPGELIGEISLLEKVPATATVIACEESRVLYVSHVELERRIATSPTFAADLYRGLAQVLSRRLRERSLALAAAVGDRNAGGAMLTPAWIALNAQVETFKDLLRGADATGEHNDLDVPRALIEDIQRKYTELSQSLIHVVREVTNAELLGEIEARVRREFVPYLHLTRWGRRALVKPRGYAGDFLTIDYLYGNEPGGVPPLGPLFDKVLLNTPVARAVRNRRGLLANEITVVLANRGDSARVTSLACGPAAEVFDVFRAHSGANLETTLIDIDFQALAFVAERRDAAGLSKRIRLEHANLVYLATGRRALDLKNQDLVYSIGLIDYFEDHFVISLLNWIHGTLSPGGKVILGNFHTCNPDRAFMDFVLDWKLVYRSEDDMNRLFEASSFGRCCTEIRFEEEGINMFACCVKD